MLDTCVFANTDGRAWWHAHRLKITIGGAVELDGQSMARRGIEVLRRRPPVSDTRRMHVFSIGAAKTGTTSVAGMFEGLFRSAHEPEVSRTTRLVIDSLENRLSPGRLERKLLARDRRLLLEVESSHPLGYLAGALASTFTNAKFIATIREPRSWLLSRLNYHHAVHPPEWQSYRDYFWHRHHRGFSTEERGLEGFGLVSLDIYLRQYSDHYRRIISEVPQERLLVVRTDQLDKRVHEIAEFVGAPGVALVPSHNNIRDSKIKALETVDPNFINSKLLEHCGDLVRAFFPETLPDYEAG